MKIILWVIAWYGFFIVNASACYVVQSHDVLFEKNSSHLSSVEVRRLADFFSSNEQMHDGEIVLTGMAQKMEYRSKLLVKKRLEMVRDYLIRTKFKGEIYNDELILKNREFNEKFERSVSLQLVPKSSFGCE